MFLELLVNENGVRSVCPQLYIYGETKRNQNESKPAF